MTRNLVRQRGTPLRPVIDAQTVDVAARKQADPVDRYVNMLLEELPGAPRKTVRENVERDLKRLAEGQTRPTSHTYYWYRKNGQLLVTLKQPGFDQQYLMAEVWNDFGLAPPSTCGARRSFWHRLFFG